MINLSEVIHQIINPSRNKYFELILHNVRISWTV